jgi:hypothetical protein
MTFDSFITALVTSGALTAAILWIARLWVSERLKQSIGHEYSTELEKHKATLKAEFDFKLAEHQSALTSENAVALERLRADLSVAAASHKAAHDQLLSTHQAQLARENSEATERLRSDLQIAAARRQVEHARLQEKVLDAVAVTYADLQDLRQASANYVSIVGFTNSPPLAVRRQAVTDAMKTFHGHYRVNQLYLPEAAALAVHEFEKQIRKQTVTFMLRVEDQERPDSTDRWNEIDEFMQTNAPKLFEQLERVFRRLIGHEPSN